MLESITDILHNTFGLQEFRLMQEEVITDVLAGKDVLCVMPTGAGKSLCYQLPAVSRDGLTLVVSPLISLMQDQVRQLRDRNIVAGYINSSQNAAEQREVMQQVTASPRALLYVAPERLFSSWFNEYLQQLTVNLLAIDEAHCISQWGHDFRPEYHRLGTIRDQLNYPPCIALTATATDDVREDIIHQLGLREPSVVITGFDRPNLSYQARCLDKAADKNTFIKQLLTAEPGSCIIYCSTRKTVDALSLDVKRTFLDRLVVGYHAGMEQSDRTDYQAKFMRTPGAIAIATNAFGMGINKPDIRLVIHHDIPGTLEAYYQEAGRAGRDREPAKCMLLYHFADRMTQEFFIERIGTGSESISTERISEIKSHATAKLDLMVRYARIARCRRQQILDYFGDESTLTDCNCDICAGDYEEQEVSDEVTTLIRKILSAVARLNGRFGAGMIADVLGGTETDRITSYQIDQLSVFGLLKGETGKNITRMLHRLIEACLIRQRDPDGLRRPILEITKDGIDVMKGIKKPSGILADLAGRKKVGKPRKAAVVIDADWQADPETLDRFEKLRAARLELAKEHALPPYVICHDKTLILIAQKTPVSPEELETIKGMGPHKVRMYGQKLLAAIQ